MTRRCDVINFILKELKDLDPDHRFDRAATEQFFKIVDDMVLENVIVTTRRIASPLSVVTT